MKIVPFSGFLNCLAYILYFFIFTSCVNHTQSDSSGTNKDGKKQTSLKNSESSNFTTVPDYAIEVAKIIKKTGRAPKGYVGGRPFQNREKKLPKQGANNRRIRYKEFDVFEKISGKNRGPERLVCGDDESVYYTKDHYKTFIKL